MKLLHVDSSILGDNSTSRVLSHEIVAQFRARHTGIDVVTRDLATHPIPHLATLPPDREDALEEFLAADIVVIGAPMYNFSIPSQLKAWIDRILVAGRTFAYSSEGAKGLAGGKRVILALSRGGLYGPGTPAHAFEHQESLLRSIFAFVGVEQVDSVTAEGIAMGPDARESALETARAQIAAL